MTRPNTTMNPNQSRVVERLARLFPRYRANHLPLPSPETVSPQALELMPSLVAIKARLDVYGRDSNDLLNSMVTVQDLLNLGLISSDGQSFGLRDMNLHPAGWRDSFGSIANAKIVGANVPTWTAFRNGIYAYSFSATAMNEAWITYHIDHDYRPGSPVFPHIHWTPSTTGTGTVRWGFEYTAAKGHNQGAFPATTTLYLEQAAPAIDRQHMIIETDQANAILGGGAIEPDTLIMCRFFRDAAHANDTYAGGAFGLFVDLHYEVDRFSTKNKAPNFYE